MSSARVTWSRASASEATGARSSRVGMVAIAWVSKTMWGAANLEYRVEIPDGRRGTL